MKTEFHRSNMTGFIEMRNHWTSVSLISMLFLALVGCSGFSQNLTPGAHLRSAESISVEWQTPESTELLVIGMGRPGQITQQTLNRSQQSVREFISSATRELDKQLQLNTPRGSDTIVYIKATRLYFNSNGPGGDFEIEVKQKTTNAAESMRIAVKVYSSLIDSAESSGIKLANRIASDLRAAGVIKTAAQ